MTTWLELLLRDAPSAEVDEHRRTLLATGPAEDVEAGGPAGAAAAGRPARAGAARGRADRAVADGRAAHVGARPAGAAHRRRRGWPASCCARTSPTWPCSQGTSLRIELLRRPARPGVPARSSCRSRPGWPAASCTTGRAAWTSDYLADPSFEHAPVADELAGSEQLRGILGVPAARAGDDLRRAVRQRALGAALRRPRGQPARRPGRSRGRRHRERPAARRRAPSDAGSCAPARRASHAPSSCTSG